MLSVSKLHEDKIEDLLFTKSETLNGNKYVISCSIEPYPDLKVSLVGDKGSSLTVVSQVGKDLANRMGGWNALALNPTDSDFFASSSINFVKKPSDPESEQLASVQLWKLKEDTLNN